MASCRSRGAILGALGSNGTMAGLVAGMRLAGMDTRVVGVPVSDILKLSLEGEIQ